MLDSSKIVKNKILIYNKNIGHCLKFFRLSKNFSQAKLAENASINFQQLQKYEKGDSMISCSMLLCFLQALEIEVSTFFDKLQNNESCVMSESPYCQLKMNHDNQIQELLSSFNKLNIQDREKVIEITKTFAKMSK